MKMIPCPQAGDRVVFTVTGFYTEVKSFDEIVDDPPIYDHATDSWQVATIAYDPDGDRLYGNFVWDNETQIWRDVP